MRMVLLLLKHGSYFCELLGEGMSAGVSDG